MDTTVILAQPRGSRLRADAVYVDRSGIRGHPRKSTFASRGKFFRGSFFSFFFKEMNSSVGKNNYPKSKSPIYFRRVPLPKRVEGGWREEGGGMGLDGMGYHLREFALWILPSS